MDDRKIILHGSLVIRHITIKGHLASDHFGGVQVLLSSIRLAILTRGACSYPMYSNDVDLSMHTAVNKGDEKVVKGRRGLTVTSSVQRVRQTRPRSWPWVHTTPNTLRNEIKRHTKDATNVRLARRYSFDVFQLVRELRPTLINGFIKSQVKYKLKICK